MGQSTHCLARAVAIALMALVLYPSAAAAQTARTRYDTAYAREQRFREVLAQADRRADTRAALLTQGREVIALYDAIVRRHPVSGYSDNALWNAAGVAASLYERFGRIADREAAARFYRRLASEYPASSLVRQIPARVAALDRAIAPADGTPPARSSTPAPSMTRAAATSPVAGSAAPTSRATLLAIDRTVLPGAVRITLSLDREIGFHEERLANPDRVFFDLKGAQAAPQLSDAVLRYPSDAVRQIRIGRHPESIVRVVLDLDGVAKYSVFTLYNPFRVVVDCELPAGRAASRAAIASAEPAAPAVVPALNVMPPPPVVMEPLPPPTPIPAPASPAPAPVNVPIDSIKAPVSPIAPAAGEPAAPPRRPEPPAAAPIPSGAPPAPVPAAPTANREGGFSLSRQLGLGISRVVIDPGHGGHDPGAQVRGLNEADLTLDIALRLEKLLLEEPGLEVVLTRRTNVFIPLEERTAIANREGADLFLSIHANASRNSAAHGIETYYLSFASSPEAEAVAARENSGSGQAMHNLPDIIKAIALNNKLDESKDLAGMVQEALVTRLRRANKDVRNLGVKKAPFVVLIGAGMPSVLAEVSFLTNRQELALLKTATYKQRIAEALQAAVVRYRRALRGQAVVADK